MTSFRCNIVNGRLFIADRPRYIEHLSSIAGPYTLSLDKYTPRKERSIPQNSYYHGAIVSVLSEETGYTPDEIHEVLKWKFLKKEVTINGESCISTKSTRDLSTAEFEDYLDQIRVWASSELGILLREPHEEG